MGFLSRLYDKLAGPPRVDFGRGAEGSEAAAAFNEELPAAAADEALVRHTDAQPTPGGANAPGALRGGAFGPNPGTGAFAEAQAEAETEDAAPGSNS
jgi:hypothetical protein